jgi:hypothetical protein
MGRPWIGLFAGLILGFVGGQAAAFAQGAESRDALVPDSASLDRIRAALASTPALRIVDPPRFYASVVYKPPASADYMKGWDLSLTRTVAPSGLQSPAGVAGFDVLQLWAGPFTPIVNAKSG